MKPGREGVVTNKPTANLATETESEQYLVPEGASDDEYEHVPARKQKPSGVSSPTRGSHLARLAPSRNGDADGKRPITDSQGTGEVNDPAAEDRKDPTAEATDHDWLRSRTSRLLDLVDPDDLTTDGMPRPEDGAPTQDMEAEGKTAHSSDEMTHDAADGVTGPPPDTGEDAADAISRTSRLFVRNLPYSATEDDVRDTFEKFGALQEVRGHLDKSIVFPVQSNSMGTHQGRWDEAHDRDSLYLGI